MHENLKDELRDVFREHGLQVEDIDIKPLGWWSKSVEWKIRVKHHKIPVVKRKVSLHWKP